LTFIPLKGQHCLYVYASASAEDVYSVALLFLDMKAHEFRVCQTFQRMTEDLRILVDAADPTTFVLEHINAAGLATSVQRCRVKANAIEFGDDIELVAGSRFDTYSDGLLYRLDYKDGQIIAIAVRELEDHVEGYYALASLPTEVYMLDDYPRLWVGNRLYIGVRFKLNDDSGVAWTSLGTLTWNVVSFATDLDIERFFCIDGSDLVVCSCDVQRDNEAGVVRVERKIYQLALP